MRAREAAVRHLLDPVLSAAFPARCLGCPSLLDRPTRGPLCEPCWQRLPRHPPPLCRCGLPLPSALLAECGRCRRGLSPYAAGASLGPYAGTLRLLVHELKYRGRRRLAPRLAEAWLREEAVRSLLSADALLVPVPLHPRRERARGFNQAALLADALSARSGLRVAHALLREKDTLPQSTLSAAERRRNVRGAFRVRPAAEVAGRATIVIDDVQTTGATARACTQALRQAGAREVRLLTVARA